MRKVLGTENLDTKAKEAIENFYSDVVKEVESAVKTNRIVIVGMAQNPVVKKARKNLEAAGLSFKYLEYGNYLSMWKPRLAVKLWSGWPTFPQVFVDSKLVGGNAELEELLKSGKIKN
jgi:monothiol glutaredoxin